MLDYYFNASIGNWSMEEYCDVIEYSGKPSDTLCTAGKWYTFIILLINNVLLLNLVIALLSDTYAKYEDKQLGLYYEVLVGNFPTMDYDDKFGSIACATAPLNLMVVPF